MLLLLSSSSKLLLLLWFWSCHVSGCGYVSEGYITFIDVTITAEIIGDYSLVSISFCVIVIIVVAVAVAVVVVSHFCGLVSVESIRSSIAYSVTVSGYIVASISVSYLNIVRLSNLQRNGSVMISVIVNS